MTDALPLSPNQIVAYNLARARALRGWTQEEAAKRLARYLGWHWSKASYSAVERSVTGRRPRHFDADDLLAFARTFKLPITWFLLPPDARKPLLSTADDPDGLPPTLMLDWLYRVDEDERRRVEELCRDLHEETHHQHAVKKKARDYLAALAQTALAEYGTATPAALRRLADLLEVATARTPIEVAGDIADEPANRSRNQDSVGSDSS